MKLEFELARNNDDDGDDEGCIIDFDGEVHIHLG